MIKSLIGVAIAASLFGAGLPVFATEATAEGFPPAQNLNFYHAPGADQGTDGMAAPMGGTTYLFLAGSAFTPRTSSQSVTYPGGGCSFSSDYVNTNLELPTNAIIQGVRLYYYSTVATNHAQVILNTYPGDGSFANVLNQSSTLSSGYASEYFPLAAPATVDNLAQSYSLIGSTDTGTRLCGMRIFYSP